MTMMVIVYAVALGLFITVRPPNEPSTLGRASPPRHPTPNFARRDDRRGAASGCAHAASRAATPRRDAAPRATPRAARRRPRRRVLAGQQTQKNICAAQKSARIDFSETGASYESLNFSQAQVADRLAHRRFSFLFLPMSHSLHDSTEKFLKKDKDHDALQAAELADVANFKAKLEAQKTEGASARTLTTRLTDEEIRDKIKQEKWTEPEADNVSPEFRSKFIRTASFGALDTIFDKGPVRDALYWLSGVNWTKVALFWFVIYCIWVFLLVLSDHGTGFKLLGGKDSAKMFDVVDNPISGVMIGILATVLVQSSSTTTSIIISLVGANSSP